MPLRFPLLLLLALSLLAACRQADPAPTDEQADAEQPDSSTTDQPDAVEEDILMPWLDRLNMREAPNTDARVVAKLNRGAELRPTGRQSANSESIVLRGLIYDEAWLEVKTADDQLGWVFGGAVTPKGIAKGNPPMGPAHFDFPVFGEFDLDEWHMVDQRTTEEGDQTSNTSLYRKDETELSVVQSESEYGYRIQHRLFGPEDVLLKERTIDYRNDMHTMSEEVIDYTRGDARRYYRSQPVDQPYQQLNDKPWMVNADWQSRG